MTRLRSPDFDLFISLYDLIFLTETKLDNLDIIHIDGFDCHTMNIISFKYKSGGVALLLKNSLHITIEIVHGDTNCVLWFKSTVNLHGYEALWGIVYIPRENSIYSPASLFGDIENGTANLRSDSNSPLYLVGDFNVRIGHLCDLIESDDQNMVLNDFDETQCNS